jgi:hypothetical protein
MSHSVTTNGVVVVWCAAKATASPGSVPHCVQKIFSWLDFGAVLGKS